MASGPSATQEFALIASGMTSVVRAVVSCIPPHVATPILVSLEDGGLPKSANNMLLATDSHGAAGVLGHRPLFKPLANVMRYLPVQPLVHACMYRVSGPGISLRTYGRPRLLILPLLSASRLSATMLPSRDVLEPRRRHIRVDCQS
jgi:hypothetical protein